jgi:ectoine hydroxylase-related dioxygenase (phytanoyl-CoA dioxygenase family)
MQDKPNKLSKDSVEFRPTPNQNMGHMKIFTEALGQSGRPFVVYFEDKANAKRGKSRFIDDVTIVYIHGSTFIEGEGEYKAGDVRVIPRSQVCGEETIGPESCHYWSISASDPTPLELFDEAPKTVSAKEVPAIPRYAPPYDWAKIEQDVRTYGVVVLEKKLSPQRLNQLNKDFDGNLEQQKTSQGHSNNSSVYNHFAGTKTTRIHGLSAFSNECAELICEDDMVDFATKIMKGACHSVRLCTAMVLEVNPGQTAQYFHSDYKAWPYLDGGPIPLNVTAMYALSDFTADNGATVFAPGSWSWTKNRNPRRDDVLPAEMSAGDVALFRADLQHGAGANITEDMNRRGLFVSYCAGWLRPVENSFLNVPTERLRELPPALLPLLGYAEHDASAEHAGVIGQYMGGDPMEAIKKHLD